MGHSHAEISAGAHRTAGETRPNKPPFTRLTAAATALALVAALVAVPHHLRAGADTGADPAATASGSNGATSYDLSGTPAVVPGGWQDGMARLAFASSTRVPASFDAKTLYDLPAEAADRGITWIDDLKQGSPGCTVTDTCYVSGSAGVFVRDGATYLQLGSGAHQVTSAAYGWDGDGRTRVVATAAGLAGFAAVAGVVDLPADALPALFPLLGGQAPPPSPTRSSTSTTAHPVYRVADAPMTSAPTDATASCPRTCYRITAAGASGPLIGYLAVTPDFISWIPQSGAEPVFVKRADLAYRTRAAHDSAAYPPLMRFTIDTGAALTLPASDDPAGEALASDLYFPSAGTLGDSEQDVTAAVANYRSSAASWAGSTVSTAEQGARSSLGMPTSTLTVKNKYTEAELPPDLIPVDLADPMSLLDDGGHFVYRFSSSVAAKPVTARIATTLPATRLDRDPSVTAAATGYARIEVSGGGFEYHPVLAVQRGRHADSITLYDLGSTMARTPFIQSLTTRLTMTHVYLPPSPSPNAANASWISGTQATTFTGTQSTTDPALFTPGSTWTVTDGQHTQLTVGATVLRVHVAGFGTYQQVDSAGTAVGTPVAVFAAQTDDGNLYLVRQSDAPAAAVQEITTNAAELISEGATAGQLHQDAVNDLFALYASANGYHGIPGDSARGRATLPATAQGISRTGVEVPTANGGRTVLSALEAQKFFASQDKLEAALGDAMKDPVVMADLRTLLSHEAAIAASRAAEVSDADVTVPATGGKAAPPNDPTDRAMARFAAVLIVDGARLQTNATHVPATYQVILALLRGHYPGLAGSRYVAAVHAAYALLGVDNDAAVFDNTNGDQTPATIRDQRGALDGVYETSRANSSESSRSCTYFDGGTESLGMLTSYFVFNGESTDDRCVVLAGDTSSGTRVLAANNVSIGDLAVNRWAQAAMQADYRDLTALGKAVPALASLGDKVHASHSAVLALLTAMAPDLASAVLNRIANDGNLEQFQRFTTAVVTTQDIANAASLVPFLLSTVVRLFDRLMAYTTLTATNLSEMVRLMQSSGYLNAVIAEITRRLPTTVTGGMIAKIDFGSIFKDVASRAAFDAVPISTAFNNMGGYGTISGIMVLAVLAAKYATQPFATWQDKVAVAGTVFTVLSYLSHYVKSYAALRGLLSTTSTIQASLDKMSQFWGGYRDLAPAIGVIAADENTRLDRIAYVLFKKELRKGELTEADIKDAYVREFYTNEAAPGNLDAVTSNVYRELYDTAAARLHHLREIKVATYRGLRTLPITDPAHISAMSFEDGLTSLARTTEFQRLIRKNGYGKWVITDPAALSKYLKDHYGLSATAANYVERYIEHAASADFAEEDGRKRAQSVPDLIARIAPNVETDIGAALDEEEAKDTHGWGSAGYDAGSDREILASDGSGALAMADTDDVRAQVAADKFPDATAAERESLRLTLGESRYSTIRDTIQRQASGHLDFSAVAAVRSAAFATAIVVGDLGSGIFSLILAVDLLKTNRVVGALSITSAVLYIFATVLEIVGMATAEFGAFLLAMVFAIISLVLQMLPPDPSQDRGALFDWAAPYARLGLLADPTTVAERNLSITALQAWHERKQSPTAPFPSCTTTDPTQCTFEGNNAPRRGCLQNLGDNTYLSLAYAGTRSIGGVYKPTRNSGCNDSDNKVLILPELGGDTVRVIAPGTAPEYPGDYSLASKEVDASGIRGAFYFQNWFEPDATDPAREWTRHNFDDGSFQLESVSEPGQCLSVARTVNNRVDSLSACNAGDNAQHWKWTAEG